MNKLETIDAAKAAGVVRTDAQFEAMNKGVIAELTEAYNKMTPEEKEAANAEAAKEAEEAAAKEAEEAAAKEAEASKNKASKVENSEKLEKDLADVFKNYPELKEVYSTTDDTIFFKKDDAVNHQKTLVDSKNVVSTHKR